MENTVDGINDLVNELNAEVEKRKQALKDGDSKSIHFDQLTTLREQAVRYHNEVDVEFAGRTRLLSLVSVVYAQYHDLEDNFKSDRMVYSKCKEAIEVQGNKVKSNTSDPILLMRYSFPGFSDKQISVFAASLTQALKDKVKPEAFIVYVTTNGGFDGVRRMGVKAKQKANNTLIGAVDGTQEIYKFESIDSLDPGTISWKADERFRIVVLTRNDDDSAELRDPMFNDLVTYSAIDTVVSDETRIEQAVAKEKAKEAAKAKSQLNAMFKKIDKKKLKATA